MTSGDLTRAIVAARASQTVFHIGPKRDLPLFAGLDVSFVPNETADYIVCTGLFNDEGETPEDYRATLRRRSHATCSCYAPIPTSWSSAARN